MPEAQTGSTTLPILMIPRIGGVPVTLTEIKNDFSNVFLTDFDTPFTFTLEYQERGGPVNTQAFSAPDTTDTIVFFPVPDSFYENDVVWTLLPFWQIVGLTKTEKIYADEAIMFEVKDLHLGI